MIPPTKVGKFILPSCLSFFLPFQIIPPSSFSKLFLSYQMMPPSNFSKIFLTYQMIPPTIFSKIIFYLFIHLLSNVSLYNYKRQQNHSFFFFYHAIPLTGFTKTFFLIVHTKKKKNSLF